MKNFYKYFLVLLLLISANSAIGQWRLIMEVVVTDEGKKLANSEIKVFRNGSLVETVKSDARGRADIPMDPDGNYTIEIGGNNGFIKKKIDVNTKGVPPESANGNFVYSAEVELFNQIDGLDLAILNKPIGKLEFNPEYGDFAADLDYTKKVRKDLEDLKESYLEKKELEKEKQEAKQDEYDDAIKIADKAYADERWEEAEAAYKKAQAILPIETYPSFQLAELETKLIKIRETNKKYDDAIAKADAAFATKDYKTAVAEFKRASGYKPEEAYPKDKLSEVQGMLALQAKAEQNYLSAIERGDNALKVNDLESAKTAFTEAVEAKPSESYPKNKLAEINDILNKQDAKEEEYQAAIKAGDEALAAEKFEDAKAAYQKASTVKPIESYPKDQLTKLDGLMAAAAKKEQNYLTAIEKADNALAANNFEEAKTAYDEASGVKPNEAYPKNKLQEIDAILAKREAADKAYEDKISTADKALGNKEYESAKTAYAAAAQLKPSEAYPSEKISEIDAILEKQVKLEENYNASILAGDQAREKEQYEEAKAAYNKAISLKPEESYPKEKLSEIQSIVLKNKEAEENYNKAIQNGDAALAAKDFDKAKEFYNEALALKSEEQYPKNQLAGIKKTIAERAEKDKNYQLAIDEGDAALEAKELEKAKRAYNNALSIKPEESYPKDQLAAIEEQFAASKQLEADYKAAIASGDEANEAKNYAAAKGFYEKALAIKSNENYPQTKIKEINSQLADAAQQEELYAKNISEADALLEAKNYKEAKAKYNVALSIKADEQYPKDKINSIDTELAAIAAKQAEIRLKNEKEAEKEAEYAALISEADKLLAAKNYESAKSKYEAALSIKEDAYPVQKIEEIEASLLAMAKEAKEEAAAAEQAKIDAKYQGIVAEADALLEEKKFQEAKLKYEAALAVKEVQYPRDQLSAIDAQLAAAAKKEAESAAAKADAKKEAEYIALITDADALFEQQRYEKAKVKYEDAIALKEDSYPASQLAEIERRMKALAERDARAAKEKKIDEDYILTIQQAEAALSNDQFEESLDLFKKARDLKPNETYPQNKIDQIRDILNNSEQSLAAQQAIIESKYMESITLADMALIEQDYVDAKEYFKNAKKLKPNESYPQRKLDEIDALLAKENESEEIKLQQEREAKNEAAYQTAIAKADKLFSEKNYNEAENEYKLALGLKPSENYPKEQILRIAQIREDLAAAKALEAKEKENKASQEAKYKEYIALGDEALEGESYVKAKGNYQSALSIKPNESYPRNKINAIDKLLEERALAEKLKEEKKEAPIQIRKGPKSTISGNAEAEIEKRYQEIWAKKNSDKTKIIKEKEEAVRKLSDANREAEQQKRQNAIEEIESISITLREQESVAEDLNMQNYEKVKQKTEDLTEEDVSLKRESERKRNDEYADAEQKQITISSNQTEKSENLVKTRTENLEKKTENIYKEEKQLKSNAEQERINVFSDVKEQESAIRSYQKERSEDLMEGRKDEVENEYASLMATNNRLEKEQSARIDKAEQDYVLKEEEIRLYNKKLAAENLNANTNQINKVEDDWKETTTAYRKESKERVIEEQEKINDKEIELKQFNQERSDDFKNNQAAIEEKEKKLKEEDIRLEAESKTRRQENIDKEYYDGEDRPRQDAEAADLPQGVSEEIIENPNNSTTIRRTVVNGTEVDVYEKTFFPWGGVFYTKNGNNITEENWNNNSR